MEKVKFHFDPRCPWCYQTSRWVRRLEELGAVEVDWGVFSLEVVNLEEGKDPHSIDAVSGPALRTAIAIRDSVGSKAIGAFYAALGKRIWEQAPPREDTMEAIRESLEEAGLHPKLWRTDNRLRERCRDLWSGYQRDAERRGRSRAVEARLVARTPRELLGAKARSNHQERPARCGVARGAARQTSKRRPRLIIA